MTGQEMLNELGKRLEDTGNVSFTGANKLIVLNNMQLELFDRLDRRLLRPFETQSLSVTATDGVYKLSTLSPAPQPKEGRDIHGGVYMVRAESATPADLLGGNQLEWIDPEDPRINGWVNNAYLTPLTGKGYWTFDGIDTARPILKLIPTATDVIAINYLNRPTDLVASAVECEFDEPQHKILIDMAESQIWLSVNQQVRSEKAQARSDAAIDALNAPFQETS